MIIFLENFITRSEHQEKKNKSSFLFRGTNPQIFQLFSSSKFFYKNKVQDGFEPQTKEGGKPL